MAIRKSIWSGTSRLSKLVKEEVSKQINARTIAIAEIAMQELTSNPPIGTPVDTGHASNNWLMAIDRRRRKIYGEPHKKLQPKLSLREIGFSEIRKFDILKGHKGIHLVNNVKYINRLNDGWSLQSPANFVEKALAFARTEAERRTR